MIRLLQAAFVFTALLACHAINASAAEYFLTHREYPWKDMSLDMRLELLTQDGMKVFLRGPIQNGDFDELQKIHALVPIYELKLSSPGGSVAEALKFAQFVTKNLVEVSTDWSCDGKTECGCVSSCALIWLAAPSRSGAVVKVHRPYFINSDFGKLPDSKAIQIYNTAIDEVRSLLIKRGYSSEFVTRMLLVPRERARELTRKEIVDLPIDFALDELARARCYEAHESTVKEHVAREREIRRLEAEREALDIPGDKPGYELERNPRYAKEWAKYLQVTQALAKLQKLHDAGPKSGYSHYRMCIRNEMKQASLRTSGERLSAEQRAKVKEFAQLAYRAGNAGLMAKYLPDHKWGQKANDELREIGERVRILWEDIQTSFPTTHAEFISSAMKQ